MVYYSEAAEDDLYDILIGLATWKKMFLSFEQATNLCKRYQKSRQQHLQTFVSSQCNVRVASCLWQKGASIQTKRKHNVVPYLRLGRNN